MRGEDKYDFDMQKVVELVKAAGVTAYVEHTGGGVATIYAGEEVDFKDGDHTYRVHKVAAGPGTYAQYGAPMWASLRDFAVGPNDYGEAGYVDCSEVGAHTVEDIAKIIVAQASLPFGELLDREALTELGFDPTGRSMPPDMAWDQERAKVGNDAYNEVNRSLHASNRWTQERSSKKGGAAREMAITEWEKTHPHPDPMVAAKMVEEGRLQTGYGPIVKITGPNSLSSPGTTERAAPLVDKPYHVAWEVDLTAASPEEAARKALAMQRDPESIATVFDVYDGTTGKVTVDLSEEDN